MIAIVIKRLQALFLLFLLVGVGTASPLGSIRDCLTSCCSLEEVATHSCCQSHAPVQRHDCCKDPGSDWDHFNAPASSSRLAGELEAVDLPLVAETMEFPKPRLLGVAFSLSPQPPPPTLITSLALLQVSLT